MSVLHRPTGLDANQIDLAFFRPTQHPSRGEQRTFAHSWFTRIGRGSICCLRTSRSRCAGGLPTLVRHTTDIGSLHVHRLVLDALAPHPVCDIHSAAHAWPTSPTLHSTLRSDPASARTDKLARSTSRACVRSDELQPIRTQCLLSDPQAPTVFPDDCSQRFLVRSLPVVECGVAYSMLSAKIRRLYPGLMLLQHRYDLFQITRELQFSLASDRHPATSIAGPHLPSVEAVAPRSHQGRRTSVRTYLRITRCDN